MASDGSVTLVWAGDERKFRLGIDEILALQKRVDAGPMQLARRLQDGTWRLDDVTETIRIGLLGAGVSEKDARELVERQVRPGNIRINVAVAFNIVAEALQGEVDDPVGKEPATTEAPETIVSPPPPSLEVGL